MLLVLAVHERNNLIDVVLAVMNFTTKVFKNYEYQYRPIAYIFLDQIFGFGLLSNFHHRSFTDVDSTQLGIS